MQGTCGDMRGGKATPTTLNRRGHYASGFRADDIDLAVLRQPRLLQRRQPGIDAQHGDAVEARIGRHPDRIDDETPVGGGKETAVGGIAAIADTAFNLTMTTRNTGCTIYTMS